MRAGKPGEMIFCENVILVPWGVDPNVTDSPGHTLVAADGNNNQ